MVGIIEPWVVYGLGTALLAALGAGLAAFLALPLLGPQIVVPLGLSALLLGLFR